MIYMYVIVILFIFCIVNISVQYYSFYEKLWYIPSPSWWPVIGVFKFVYRIQKNFFDEVMELMKNHKKIVAIWLGPLVHIVVLDPEYLQIIFSDYRKTKKGYVYEFLKNTIGDSILSNHGQEYEEKKKIIMQTLSTKNVIKFTDNFNKNCKKITEKVLSTMQGKQCMTVHMDDYIREYSIRSLMESVLGVPPNSYNEEDKQRFAKAFKKIEDVLTARCTNPLIFPNFLFKFSKYKKIEEEQNEEISSLINKWINESKMKHMDIKEARKQNTILNTFLSGVKVGGEVYSDKEIRDEMALAMAAGLETSIYTIEIVLCLLGKYRDIQCRVYEEIVETMDNSLSYQEIGSLTYLYQVVQEAWRLFPPINFATRVATEDIDLGYCIIPNGANIVIPLKFINLNEDVFPNAEDFNPENFNPDIANKRHPFSYFPFLSGYRKCVGAKYATTSILLFLASFIRNFEITYEGEVEIEKHLIIFPEIKDKLKLIIRKRE